MYALREFAIQKAYWASQEVAAETQAETQAAIDAVVCFARRNRRPLDRRRTPVLGPRPPRKMV